MSTGRRCHPSEGFRYWPHRRRSYAARKHRKETLEPQCHIDKDTPWETDFANFAQICGMEKNWSQDQVLERVMEEIRAQANRDGRERKVLLFLSGGVDSTVAFALLNTALGQERVLGLHIDNGFMRKNESAIIAERYREAGFTNFMVEDASETFLAAVAGKIDPQKKRMAVGETFITVRDTVVARLGLNEDDWLLGQGTLYPDIIEPAAARTPNDQNHHNRVDVYGASSRRASSLNLRDLYKDEVRILGKISVWTTNRTAIPSGPGLSINVLCQDGTPADEAALSRAREELSRINLAAAFRPAIPLVPAHARAYRNRRTPGQIRGRPGRLPHLPLPGRSPVRGYLTAFPAWSDLEAASSKITNASKE